MEGWWGGVGIRFRVYGKWERKLEIGKKEILELGKNKRSLKFLTQLIEPMSRHS